MRNFSLILSILWFFIAGLLSVVFFRSFGTGEITSILMYGITLLVSGFAGVMNLRRFLRMKNNK